MCENDITTNYDFNERQTNYYTVACMYLLGLVKKYCEENKQPMFKLISIGREIVGLGTRDKFLRLTRCNLYNINSNDTYVRRDSTIIS